MPRAPASLDSADGAQSVRRAMAILRLVAAGQDRGVRLTDVAAMSGLTAPTVHRFLKVLMDETAVEQDPTTRRYRIGHEITLLGLARPGGVSIRAIAEPYLAALAANVGDTVFLSVRHGADSVSIARHLGSHPIQVLSIDVGARRPLGASVSGIVLLAGMPPDEARALTQRNEKRLKGSGRSVKDVLAAVDACRAQGYTYAQAGVMPGTSAMAVPILDPAGTLVAAISIATLAERLPRDRVRGVLAKMQEQVRLVTVRLREIERARPTRR
jgi:DNA-binding IclR family transcriptional regulator